MPRALVDAQARLLNHAEFVYPPGDRDRTRHLFELLGCSVLDPQKDPVPEEIGPAAAPYLIVFLDPGCDDPFDNVLYLSEVPPAQWSFEQRLRETLGRDEKLARAHEDYRDERRGRPQAATHLGLAFPSPEQLEATIERLRADPQLEGRVDVSKIFRPGQPGAADDRVLQAFVQTDLCSTGWLCVEQRFELQVRLDL